MPKNAIRILVTICLFATTAFAGPSTASVSETLEIAGITRTYYLHVPKNLPEKTAVPLLLVFHGAGSRGVSVVEPWTRLADTQGFIVLGLDLTISTRWLMPEDGPEPIKTLIDALRTRYPIDESRVYLFGHSAGAIFGLKLGLIESEYFAAVAVHAGAFLQPAAFEILPLAKRKIPFKIIVGDRDPRFSLETVNATVKAFTSAGHPVDLEVIGGHDHNYADGAQNFNEKAWQFLKVRKLASPPKYVKYTSLPPSARGDIQR